jgi:hypothetical protein
VADVLGVAAVEVSDPVGLVVLMEGNDLAEDGHGKNVPPQRTLDSTNTEPMPDRLC